MKKVICIFAMVTVILVSLFFIMRNMSIKTTNPTRNNWFVNFAIDHCKVSHTYILDTTSMDRMEETRMAIEQSSDADVYRLVIIQKGSDEFMQICSKEEALIDIAKFEAENGNWITSLFR